MTDAEHAVQKAAANIPGGGVRALRSADKLSDEDRKAIIEIARQALAQLSTQAAATRGETPTRSHRQGKGMSDTIASLRRKIASAGDLQSVVRTMKALAASSIGQYERSVQRLGRLLPRRGARAGRVLSRERGGPTASAGAPGHRPKRRRFGAIVFGSDQGLVGQFNDVVADFAIKTLSALPGKPQVWAVGERVHARLADAGLPLVGLFAVPNSVQAITPLVGQIQIESETHRAKAPIRRGLRLP